MNEENWEAGIFGIVADNCARAHREAVRNQEPEEVTGEPVPEWAPERTPERKRTHWWLLIVAVVTLALAGGSDAGYVSLQTISTCGIMAVAAFMASAGI